MLNRFLMTFALILVSSGAAALFGQQKPFCGLGLSPFRAGQSPATGVLPTVDQLREDIRKIKPYTENIRTYGNNGTLGEFPRLCQEEGMGLYLGVWLDANYTNNRATLDLLKQQLKAGYTCIKGVVVGNECVLRYNDYQQNPPPSQLISYINEIQAVTDLPVTTGESYWHLNIAAYRSVGDACDFILYHVHPYWNGKAAPDATEWVVQAYNAMKKIWPNKEAICGETGWPTAGLTRDAAVAGVAQQETFLKELTQTAKTMGLKYLWFSAFDEPWKATDGESNACQCGANWGLWYEPRTAKQSLSSFAPVSVAAPNCVRQNDQSGSVVLTSRTVLFNPVRPTLSRVGIYTLGGSLVRSVVCFPAATRSAIDLSAMPLRSGAYIVRIQAGNRTAEHFCIVGVKE